LGVFAEAHFTQHENATLVWKPRFGLSDELTAFDFTAGATLKGSLNVDFAAALFVFF